MSHPPYPVHGGDLAFATATWGAPAEGWLDLSTGINPTPYPATSGLLAPDVFHRLPDRAALAGLEAVARTAYGVRDDAVVVAVPGSEIAIRILPHLAPPHTPGFILSPVYGSHRAAWPAATPVGVIDAIPDASVAILANPNNPDGRQLSAPALAALAKRVAWLIVDEAFADVAPETSIVPTLPKNTLVLRSLGKFYGLAGVRLGFVIGNGDDVARIKAALGDWPVSGPAIAIGTAALTDARWRDAIRVRLKDETTALRSLLAAHGLLVVGGTDLFTLIDSDDARALHDALARRGIWTRVFAEHPSWLRVGLPGTGLPRLEKALTDLR